MISKTIKPFSSFRSRPKVLLFLLPSLIGILVFFVVPFFDVFRRSFLNNSGDSFVGLANYSSVLTNEAFYLAASNTLKFMLVCIPTLIVLSMLFAIFIRRNTLFCRVVKTTMLIPLAIPVFTVAVLISITFDFNGIANGILNFFGFEPISWLETDAAFWVLVGNYIWRNLGYCIILWLAAMACIPESIYDAAKIDGANAFQVFRRITLPSLLPSFFVVTILAIINSFKVYREAYLVAGNYPHESIYLLPHLFNNWFASLSIAKQSAGGVLLCLFLSLIVFLLYKAWNKKDEIA